MRWLYRLQTRLGLTGPEGTALLVLSLGLSLGLGVAEVQSHSAPPSADLYALSDAAFVAASAPVFAAQATAVPGTDPVAEAIAEVADDSLSVETVEAAPAPASSSSSSRGRSKPSAQVTNLNTGSAEQLQSLPGIGPALAGRIIEYRNQHGPFRRIDQIVEVKGIGPKTFEKMRPWLRL